MSSDKDILKHRKKLRELHNKSIKELHEAFERVDKHLKLLQGGEDEN